MPIGSFVVAALSVCIALTIDIGSVRSADTRLEFFEKKIRPVLVAHCYECHSTEADGRGKLKAGLVVDTRAGLLKGGESGASVTPGKPAESLLLSAIKHDGLEMPPNQKLPPEVIADFEKWISDGAYDPREGEAVVKKRGMSIEDGRKFWSFIPPRDAPLPEVRQKTWPTDALDHFILAKLDEQRLAPAADAEPRIFVRRLYYDLIGLPPTEAETTSFLRSWDRSPDSAIESTVDTLLASPHFGERWGRHWLDVARYADSNGRDRNVYYYHAWRYRDYVIDSFNRDQPFDLFVREQIAGDLLPAESRDERDRRRIATGFLALGPKAFEEQKPEVFRMDVIDEQIELVGRAVLGLSVGCARCHDHKFDPIPTADYYALAGIFRNAQPLYGYGPKGIKATAYAHTELQPLGPDAERSGAGGLAYLAKLHELTLAQNTARSDRYRIVRRVSAAKLDMQKPGADKAKFETDIAKMEAEVKDWDVKVKAHEAALQSAMDHPPRMPGWAMGLRERDRIEDCRIHIRGDTLNLGETVPRGMLQVVPLSNSPSIAKNESGRLQLAEWLTDRRNPLTARVYVNRIWLHLFGRGLVSTPDDFGVNGARPSHAELLDHLAVRFMNGGWSTKRLVRELVMSRTYRQGIAVPEVTAEPNGGASSVSDFSVVDPDNVFLSHMRPRRLEAEVIRDAIMQVAGTLDRSPPPQEQAFLAKYNPYREDEFRTFQPLFASTQIEHPHRSVYLPVVRGVLPEVFRLFDFASPDRSTSQREESVVPAQSLYFLNNEWVIGQAKALSEWLLKIESLDDAGRIGAVYRRAFSREPTAREIERALQYLSSPESLIPDPKVKTPPNSERLRLERWVSFCQIIFASAEFRYVN
ncbi:MAG: PSD1 and planctomycete cytochrome C domain-containing protein [Planctomycetia bacterium]|nr:PSD1 and planctomycete cytochrome C domain-containing protein [Planctomycetia bacterium]